MVRKNTKKQPIAKPKQLHRLPKAYQKFITGQVVDFSSASKYWHKIIEVVIPRNEKLVREKGPHKYELRNKKLFDLFISQLISRVAQNPELSKPDLPLTRQRFCTN